MKGHFFSFEKLEVWKNSIKFAKLIYNVTNYFPNEERFGLVPQIRRAAISISSNIAEGSAKKSLKEQAKFTEISFGSLLEILNQTIIAKELKYINEEKYTEIREKILELSRQINALKNSQLRRIDGK
jgi:four helix bundle protein